MNKGERGGKRGRGGGGGGGGDFREHENRVMSLLILESIMETCSVVQTFESVDKSLWCDHLN